MASWDILGNNGTNPNDPNGNFLGTIDNEPLVIRTHNTERLRVDENGNVGIGTTTPNYALTVNGNSIVGKAQSSAGAPASYVYDEGSGYLGFLKRGTSQTGNMGLGNNASEIVSTSGNLGLYTYTSGGYLAFGTNATERLRVDETGRVGIGTTEPSRLLTLEGGPELALQLRDTRFSAYWELQASAFLIEHFGIVRYEGGVAQATMSLIISPDGNVGIGTTNPFPQRKLDVQATETITAVAGNSVAGFGVAGSNEGGAPYSGVYGFSSSATGVGVSGYAPYGTAGVTGSGLKYGVTGSSGNGTGVLGTVSGDQSAVVGIAINNNTASALGCRVTALLEPA